MLSKEKERLRLLHTVHITDRKGFMFTIDLQVAFLLVLFMLFLSVLTSFYMIQKEKELLEEFERERNAIMLADFLVKRGHDQNGLAKLDTERGIVLENEIDAEKIVSNIKSLESFLRSKDVAELYLGADLLFKNNSLTCEKSVAIERGVITKGDFAILKVVICYG